MKKKILLYCRLFCHKKIAITKKDKNHLKAFTLPEVLITLAIIGVVAAITLSTIISNVGDKKLISGVKKEYAMINQVLLRIQNDYSLLGDYSPFFAEGKDSNVLTQEMQKYFNGAIYCPSGSVKGACANANYKIQLTYPVQQSIDDKTPVVYNSIERPRLILADGSIISPFTYANGCAARLETDPLRTSSGSIITDESGTVLTRSYYTYYCGEIRFDVNGAQKPNQYGRDIFVILVNRNGIGHVASIFGSETFKNILNGKSNPFVYKKFSSTEEIYGE